MEEERVYKVYIHICLINLKVYIGITKQKPEQRWRNGKGYRNNVLFYRAIQKYGWDNFKHVVLFDHLTKEEAGEIEIELINFHKSNNPKFGYNISDGGEYGMLGVKHTDEVKNKLKNINLGKHHTQETKQKISKMLSGEKHPFFGKHHTQETKDKISKNHADMSGCNNPNYGKDFSGENNPKSKKIICLNTLKIYNCIKYASDELGVSHISTVCRGKLKSTKGYSFMYLDDYNKLRGNNV